MEAPILLCPVGQEHPDLLQEVNRRLREAAVPEPAVGVRLCRVEAPILLRPVGQEDPVLLQEVNRRLREAVVPEPAVEAHQCRAEDQTQPILVVDLTQRTRDQEGLVPVRDLGDLVRIHQVQTCSSQLPTIVLSNLAPGAPVLVREVNLSSNLLSGLDLEEVQEGLDLAVLWGRER